MKTGQVAGLLQDTAVAHRLRRQQRGQVHTDPLKKGVPPRLEAHSYASSIM